MGFPAETAELAEKLNDSQFRAGLKAEYQNFLQAHNEDSSLLRFHYHKLERLAQRLDELDLPLREYQSSTVDHYELVMQEGNSSMGSGVARGAVGAALFGGIGAIAGANSAKKNSDYTVSIIFKDGTKALCSLDADNYKALVRIMY